MIASLQAYSAAQPRYQRPGAPSQMGQRLQAPAHILPKHLPFASLATRQASDQTPNARILLITDDRSWGRQVAEYFFEYNFAVTTAANKQDANRFLAVEGRFNMVVLARQVGGEDGLELLRGLRTGSDLPVVMTSFECDEEEERVLGLELGADDYLAGSFSMRELLARVRAVLRRAPATTDKQIAATSLRFGQWTLNRRTRNLTDGAGQPVVLTKSEYALLAAFVEAPQTPLTREHLLKATRVHEDVYDRSIDVQVLRLRRKLDIDTAAPSVIQAQRGVGYTFTLPVECA